MKTTRPRRAPRAPRSPPPPPTQHRAEPAAPPPGASPQRVVCVGLNYEDRAAETGAPIPEKPIVFSKYANSIIGSGEAIRIPPITQQPDYEAELAVIIGRTARNVPESKALDYVFGYTNANDVSARDIPR